jgi:hypothetical protein
MASYSEMADGLFCLDEHLDANPQLVRLTSLPVASTDRPDSIEHFDCVSVEPSDVEPDDDETEDEAEPLAKKAKVACVPFPRLCAASALFATLRHREAAAIEDSLRGKPSRSFEEVANENRFMDQQARLFKRKLNEEENLFLRNMYRSQQEEKPSNPAVPITGVRLSFSSCRSICVSGGLFAPEYIVRHPGIDVQGLKNNRFNQYATVVNLCKEACGCYDAVFEISNPVPRARNISEEQHRSLFQTSPEPVVKHHNVYPMADDFVLLPPKSRFILDEPNQTVGFRFVMILFEKPLCKNVQVEVSIVTSFKGDPQRFYLSRDSTELGCFFMVNNRSLENPRPKKDDKDSRAFMCVTVNDSAVWVKVFNITRLHSELCEEQDSGEDCTKSSVLFEVNYALLFDTLNEFIATTSLRDALMLVNPEDCGDLINENWGADVWKRCYRAQRLVRLASLLCGIPTTRGTSYLQRLIELNSLMHCDKGRAQLEETRQALDMQVYAPWNLGFVIAQQPDMDDAVPTTPPFKVVKSVAVRRQSLFLTEKYQYLC